MKGMLIRGSELQEFLRCRWRWDHSYNQNLEPKRQSTKLVFGNAMHKFLELWYGGQGLVEAYAKADQMLADGIEDQLEYQTQSELLRQVTHNYAKAYAVDRWDLSDYEVLATEFTFAIPLVNGIYYTGTIDLVLREKSTGRVWFSDHKTTSSIDKYDKNSDLDRQISRYWWALQQLAKGRGYIQEPEIIRVATNDHWIPTKKHPLGKQLAGIEPYGFFYNIILKDYPTSPKVLAKGGLSQDKRQKTTYELYAKAMVEQGLAKWQQTDKGLLLVDADPAYKEMLDYLIQTPREFFRRVRVVRNQTEIDMAMAEAIATARDMKSVRNKLKKPHRPDTTPIYRNITTDCSWDCGFFDLCKASLDGSDVSFLKDSLYQQKVV